MARMRRWRRRHIIISIILSLLLLLLLLLHIFSGVEFLADFEKQGLERLELGFGVSDDPANVNQEGGEENGGGGAVAHETQRHVRQHSSQNGNGSR